MCITHASATGHATTMKEKQETAQCKCPVSKARDLCSQKSQTTEMQCCGTFHWILYSQLHTGEDLEEPGKENESNSVGIFP